MPTRVIAGQCYDRHHPPEPLPMLNDIKSPPPEPPDEPARGVGGNGPGKTLPRLAPEVEAPLGQGTPPHEPGVKPHTHLHTHTDPNELGVHKARIVGDRTTIDPLYAMPMEDRGSTFSLYLSIAVVVIFSTLLLIVWWTMFRTASPTP